MYTLNLKVLFVKVIRALPIATLCWVMTSALGSIALTMMGVIGLPFYQIYLLSLIFSLPAQVIITPGIAFGTIGRNRYLKWLYVLFINGLACTAVVLFFLIVTKGYPFDKGFQTMLLLPYVCASYVIVPVAFYRFMFRNQKTNQPI